MPAHVIAKLRVFADVVLRHYLSSTSHDVGVTFCKVGVALLKGRTTMSWKAFLSRAWLTKAFMNLWPPFSATGIKVKRVSPDFKTVEVVLKHKFYNRNAVGTHFGGSLFTMTDPFPMLQLLHRIGHSHIVWDSAAQIQYLRPGKGPVTATIELSDSYIASVVQKASGGKPLREEFTVDIIDSKNQVVARVIKTVYIRRKDGPKEK